MKLMQKLNSIKQLKLDYSSQTLLMEALNLSLTQLFELLDKDLSQEQEYAIDKCVRAVQRSIPIARVTGVKYFWKNLFNVSPYTLDPRHETEAIVECAVLKTNPATIIDLGTGTGCILLSLLHEFPGAHGVGVDISHLALETARQNTLQLANSRANFLQSDWYANVYDKFDLIVSNPPYVRTKCAYEALFDPPISLWDQDSQIYNKLISRDHLNDGGSIILEVPDYSLDIVNKAALQENFKVELFKTGSISICLLQ